MNRYRVTNREFKLNMFVYGEDLGYVKKRVSRFLCSEIKVELDPDYSALVEWREASIYDRYGYGGVEDVSPTQSVLYAKIRMSDPDLVDEWWDAFVDSNGVCLCNTTHDCLGVFWSTTDHSKALWLREKETSVHLEGLGFEYSTS